MQKLRFETTHRYQFPSPVLEVSNPTAMTICIRDNDPNIAFITQSGYQDPIHFLNTDYDLLHDGDAVPASRPAISGMGWDPIRKWLICTSSTHDSEEVFALDPDTMQEMHVQNVGGDSELSLNAMEPQGIAMSSNGMSYANIGRVSGDSISRLEVRTRTGGLIGEKDYANRAFAGICATPWSWCCVDRERHEIVLLGAFGSIVGTLPGLGPAGGMQAIAFDTISDMRFKSQRTKRSGLPGGIGSIHHFDTPWNPAPWLGRHRLYVANNADATIYAGYLTAS